jgi:hypothetical protein
LPPLKLFAAIWVGAGNSGGGSIASSFARSTNVFTRSSSRFDSAESSAVRNAGTTRARSSRGGTRVELNRPAASIWKCKRICGGSWTSRGEGLGSGAETFVRPLAAGERSTGKNVL